jgi:hypothetical protein
VSEAARTLAQSIATGLDASVHALPCAAPQSAHVVQLADGRVAVLVQSTQKHLGVTLGTRGWHQLIGAPDATLVADVVAAARQWASSKPVDKVTTFELARDLPAALAAAVPEGGPWRVSVDGTFERVRFAIRGANVDAAAVNVDEDGVTAVRKMPVAKRGALESVRGLVIEQVRAQLASYAKNVALRQRMTDVATELTQRLPWRARVQCTMSGPFSTATWGWACVITIACRDARGGAEVRLTGERDRVHVHAGLGAPRGWSGEVDVVDDASLAAIADAVEKALATLTLDKLQVGARYRVRETIDGLVAGSVVTFQGYDDVDNHYGSYDFVDATGKKVGVGGDYSTPHTSTLGADTGRYLERL